MNNDIMFNIMLYANVQVVKSYRLTSKNANIIYNLYFWKEKFKVNRLPVFDDNLYTGDYKFEKWINYYKEVAEAKHTAVKLLGMIEFEYGNDEVPVQVHLQNDVNLNVCNKIYKVGLLYFTVNSKDKNINKNKSIVTLQSHRQYPPYASTMIISINELIDILTYIFYLPITVNLTDLKSNTSYHSDEHPGDFPCSQDLYDKFVLRYQYWSTH